MIPLRDDPIEKSVYVTTIVLDNATFVVESENSENSSCSSQVKLF